MLSVAVLLVPKEVSDEAEPPKEPKLWACTAALPVSSPATETALCSSTVGRGPMLSQTFFTDAIFRFRSSVEGEMGELAEVISLDSDRVIAMCLACFSSLNWANSESNVKSSFMSTVSSPLHLLGSTVSFGAFEATGGSMGAFEQPGSCDLV